MTNTWIAAGQRAVFAVLAFLVCSALARAEEGMWTFDNFPTASVQQQYGKVIDANWLRRLQRTVTRLEGGCSGSFVSPQGLLLTNHHCVMKCLSELSSPKQNFVADGFLSEEQRCPGALVSVLVDIEDVTSQVNRATAGRDAASSNQLRRQTLGRLESECAAGAKARSAKEPLVCESVSLYQGGQYFLYKYRRYDDVRMVFAPNAAAAAFGGDLDNFNFPRWSLDFSLLRVYQDGRPARTPDHLRWRVEGPRADELVFVAGHPATTSRLHTVGQLQFQHDTFVPSFMNRNAELRGRLIQWGRSGAEPARIVEEVLPGYENTLKIYRGLQQALLGQQMFRWKIEQERQLRERVAADAQLQRLTGDPWADIDTALSRHRAIFDRYLFLEGHAGFNSRLFGYARQLVRAAAERGKPNEQRLREYADSNLSKVATALLAQVPIYPGLEQLTLAFSLEKMREALGPDDPIVRQLMSRSPPQAMAADLVDGSSLAQVSVRSALWEGGAAAIAASKDPMIVLARDIDEEARAIRKLYEDEVQAPIDSAHERLAKARFATLGTETYPDATFTLRVSFGTVRGWRENGSDVDPFARIGRMYERANGADPLRLPDAWLKARPDLDSSLPLTYVTTNDIVGGNSGSPVVDADGRLVGLAFDGNIHSISGRYWYDADSNRAIAVHPAAMVAAIREVYGKHALVAEILGGGSE